MKCVESEPVVITGLALVTPYGVGWLPVLEGVKQGRTGYGPLTAIDCHTWPIQAAGWVADPPSDSLGVFNNKLRNMGKYVRLGVMATRLAMQSARIEAGGFVSERFGAFIGTGTHGHNAEGLFSAFALSRDANDQMDLRLLGQDGIDRVHPWWLLSTISNNLIFFLTHFFQLKGPNTNCCNSAIASAHALDRAMEALHLGEVDYALWGGADCPVNWQLLSDFAVMGFSAEGPPEKTVPMRPYSPRASGPVMSDAAAFAILETRSHAEKRGVSPIVGISQPTFAGSNLDALEPAADGRDTRQVVAALLAKRRNPGIPFQVHLSGTGLERWDNSELAGLREFPGRESWRVSSGKAWVGHSFAASFAVETLMAAMALKENVGLGFPADAETLGECSLLPASAQLHHSEAMVLGQCFGGNTTGVLLHDV